MTRLSDARRLYLGSSSVRAIYQGARLAWFDPMTLFKDGVEGAWFDPSDLSTMFANHDSFLNNPATIGSPIALLLDKSKGLKEELAFDLGDTGAFNSTGTTPPTTNPNDEFLGLPCRSVTFEKGMVTGYGGCRGYTPSFTHEGGLFIGEFEYAVSRPLVGDERISIYFPNGGGMGSASVNSSTPAGWHRLRGNGFFKYSSHALLFAAFLAGAIELDEPVTIYVRQIKVYKIPGNHTYQATVAARPRLIRMPAHMTRRNMFRYSDDFTQSVWIKSRLEDYTYGFPDPFGGNRATRFKPIYSVDPGGSTRSASLYQKTDGQPGKARYSIFLRPVNPVSHYQNPPEGGGSAERDVLVQLRNESKGRVTFNLRDLSVVNTDLGVVTTGVEELKDGWYRFWYTAESDLTGNGNTWISFANRPAQANFDPYPDGNEEIHIYGPMFEYGDHIDLNASPPPYQKIGNEFDVTEQGVPDVYFLLGDGADDFMQSLTVSGFTAEASFLGAAFQSDVVPGGATDSWPIFGVTGGAVSVSGFSLRLRPGHNTVSSISFRQGSGTSTTASLGTAMDRSKPFVAVGTTDEEAIKAYLNGEFVAQSAAPAVGVINQTIRIGNVYQPWKFFGGVVAQRVPDISEIRQISRFLQMKMGVSE